MGGHGNALQDKLNLGNVFLNVPSCIYYCLGVLIELTARAQLAHKQHTLEEKKRKLANAFFKYDISRTTLGCLMNGEICKQIRYSYHSREVETNKS